MLARLIGSPWVLAAAAFVAAGALAGAYVKGRIDGRALVMDRLASSRIAILQDGRKIDHEVLGADDHDLCRLLGGCGVREQAGRD
jgi:hypothetical protein